MRLINLTNQEINIPIKGLNNLRPNTISSNVKLIRDIIKSYLVPLANIHQHKIIAVVTQEERSTFNDIFSVFPILNLRSYDELVEYHFGDEIPVGAYLIDDYTQTDKSGNPIQIKYLVMPNTVIADAKSGWEDPNNPGVSNSSVRFFVVSWDEYNSNDSKFENALYFIWDRRIIAKGSVIYSAVKDSDDLKEVLVKALQDQGSTDNTVPTAKAVVDYINKRFETAISGVEYRGLIDSENPSENEYWIDAHHGYMFRVSTVGSIDGIELGVGDTIIINKDVTGAPTKDDMDVIPYTLDEIGNLKLLKTEAKEDLVSAINEVKDSLPYWNGITNDIKDGSSSII